VVSVKWPLAPFWAPTSVGIGGLGFGVSLNGFVHGDLRVCISGGRKCPNPGISVAGCVGFEASVETQCLWGTDIQRLSGDTCIGVGTGGVIIGGTDGVDW
jgi:hypothetical protein